MPQKETGEEYSSYIPDTCHRSWGRLEQTDNKATGSHHTEQSAGKKIENRKVGSYFHHLVPGECSSRDLPEHETKCVHVGGLEGLDVGLVERLVKHLRRHVSPCADPRVGRDVDLIRLAVKPDGEPEVGDGAGAVPLDEDVLGLDVPVRHCRLALGPEYLRVQMTHL